MGKFKRNYSDVDRSKGYTEYAGDPPKPGIYDGRLDKVSDHTSSEGNEGTEWIFQITEEPYEGWSGWVYTNGDGAAWKELQVLEALGIIEPGEDDVNTTHEKILKAAQPVRLKVVTEKYEGENRPKLRTVLAMPDGKGKGSKAKKGKKGKVKSDSPF